MLMKLSSEKRREKNGEKRFAEAGTGSGGEVKLALGRSL